MQEFLQKHISTIVFFFFIFFFILFILRQVNLKKQNCKNIEENSQNFTFYSFNELRKANYFKSGTSNNYNCKLKDFYFKSAYNCFSSGNFKNDFVHKCALNNCSDSGVRFLDMQVFSLNNIPVISANWNDNHFQKTMYNYIHFDDAMKEIDKLFVKPTGDSNRKLKDFPLFLHFRLNCASSIIDEKHENKRNFYNKIHDILVKVFDKSSQLFTKNQKMFYKDYDDSREQIIANLSIEECQKRVFIFITLNDNSSNSENFKLSKLNEITDLLSTSEQSLAVVRSNEIVDDNFVSFRSLTNRKMVATLPQTGVVKNNNYDFSNAATNGVQFMCMNFQRFDSMLNMYNDFFISQIGSSSQNVTSPMIKKPDILLNTLGGTNESFFIPSMTYKIMTGTSICYDSSVNETDPVICTANISRNNYHLFNIYQSPDNPDNYYFKTSIQEQICDLSDDDLIYCTLNAPGSKSYFNFTRTGAETFNISNATDNTYCKLDDHDGAIECSTEVEQANATNFSITKMLL